MKLMKNICILLLSILFVGCQPNEEEYFEYIPEVEDIIIGSWHNDFSYYYGTDRYIYYDNYKSIIRFYDDNTGYWYFDNIKYYFEYSINNDILTMKLNDKEFNFQVQIKDITEITLTYKDIKRRTFKIHCNNITTRYGNHI